MAATNDAPRAYQVCAECGESWNVPNNMSYSEEYYCPICCHRWGLPYKPPKIRQAKEDEDGD